MTTSTAISGQSTQFKISTGSGGAKTITGVTLGNPTIITATAHGFVVGDYVTIASVGGATTTNAAWTVIAKTTNTFAIALDTTGGSAYTSGGTATPTTYTAVGNVKSIQGFDGSASEVDKTHLGSTAKEFLLGLVDNGSVTMELDLAWSDAGQVALEARRVDGASATFQVILPSGTTPTASFTAYVKKFSKNIQVDATVKGTVECKISGAVTWA